jgi:hypothetical protein
MAIQISGTTVIDNSRNLANIVSIDSTVTSMWDTITTTAVSKTLVNREYCTVTGAGLTMTLPASPSAGWEVSVSTGDFTNTIVGRNSQNIMGLGENMTIDAKNSTINLVYIDATRGWRFS